MLRQEVCLLICNVRFILIAFIIIFVIYKCNFVQYNALNEIRFLNTNNGSDNQVVANNHRTRYNTLYQNTKLNQISQSPNQINKTFQYGRKVQSNQFKPINYSENQYNETKVLRKSSDSNISDIENRKLILYMDNWFGQDWNTWVIDQDNLQETGCPHHNCDFTYDKKRLHEADAVFFALDKYTEAYSVKRNNFQQRWIFVDIEAPVQSQITHLDQFRKSVFNWTMTYNQEADLVATYGYLIPINGSHSNRSYIRHNQMDYESETMKMYLKVLDGGEPTVNKSFIERPKLAAWMSSHCPTQSKREVVIKELQKWMKIDTFGKCGSSSCYSHKLSWDDLCWSSVLAPNYLFYFSMENSLCEEYITEKLFLPLKFGLVPLVYGYSNYSRFLPPHSFIDIREYRPQELARYLMKLQKDSVKYKRYHLWRKFWKVQMGTSACELCSRLNTDLKNKQYHNVAKWRISNEECIEPLYI